MGELRVDASGVRAAARRVLDAVDELNEIRWPAWDPGDLAGSSVSGITAPMVVADRMTDVTAQLRAWAASAQGSVTALRTGRDAQRRPARSSVTRPTVAQALAWRPAALHDLADGWDAAARTVHARVSEVGSEAGGLERVGGRRGPTSGCRPSSRDADEVARALVTAAVAARAGCDRIEAARTDVSTRVASAVAEGFDVADDGSVAGHRR